MRQVRLHELHGLLVIPLTIKDIFLGTDQGDGDVF